MKALKDLPPQEIASKLGVDALARNDVIGSQRGSAVTDDVRVRANLIAAGHADRRVDQGLRAAARAKTLALQGDIARSIADAVEGDRHAERGGAS